MTSKYKFLDSSNTACFHCYHVLSGQGPILLVTHDLDVFWQFICGQNIHDESNAKIISIGQAIKIDGTINNLFEMPKGVGANRKSIGDKWIPYKLPDEPADTKTKPKLYMQINPQTAITCIFFQISAQMYKLDVAKNCK